MTPMIDVVFLLLIFFVCASMGQRPLSNLAFDTELQGTGMEIDVEEPEHKILDKIDLQIQRLDGKTVVKANNRTLEDLPALEEFLKALSADAAEVPVNIDADDDVPYGDIIAVLDICNGLRFETMNFRLPLPEKRPAKPKKRYR